MVCDFSDMYFASIDISKRVDCPVCHGSLVSGGAVEKLVWLCGRNTANINPEKPLKVNLKQVCESVQQQGFHIRVESHLALMFDYKGLEVSLFNGGRMLIKNVADEKGALNAYREIINKLNLS